MTNTAPEQTLFPELEQDLHLVLPNFIGCDLPDLIDELSTRIATALRTEYTKGKSAHPTTIVKIPTCEWTPATVIKNSPQIQENAFQEKAEDLAADIQLDESQREKFLYVLTRTLSDYYRRGLRDSHETILDRAITPNYTPSGIMR